MSDDLSVSDLTRHGSSVRSVFSLMGQNENDVTAALGYALSRSPTLCSAVLQRVWPRGSQLDEARLALETRDGVGRTDLELRLPGALVIFEAKSGWAIPHRSQLEKYASRIVQQPRGGVLVTLSQASPALAAASGLPDFVDGVPVVHLPWSAVLTDVSSSREGRRGAERLWLDELHSYLREVIRMRRPEDSRTYCVVLNNERPAGGGKRTFLEYVIDEGYYFHPYGGGNGWPTEAPNFMAFRWDGHVQRIHRVIHHEVLPALQHQFSDVPVDSITSNPHALYRLGPPLRFTPIPNGKQYRASRLWVLLDQLLTEATLAAAWEKSRALMT